MLLPLLLLMALLVGGRWVQNIIGSRYGQPEKVGELS